MGDRREEKVGACSLHGPMEAGQKVCPRCVELAVGGKVIVAACPSCSKLLNVALPEIKDQPSIKMTWRYNREPDAERHLLHVSAIWGDMALISEPPITEGEVLDLFCPFCEKPLPVVGCCRTCNAQMVWLKALHRFGGNNHGRVQVCVRRGCPTHRVEILTQADRLVALHLATGFRPGP